MSTASREQLKELFDQASRLPPGPRRALVERVTRDSPNLGAELRQLLPALDDSGFMSAPTVAADPATTSDDASAAATQASTIGESAGARIGRYQLLQQIGEGGFGTVFMAEQSEPVSRRVALKIIKAGMDTRQVIARFEAERQALAMMDHPNIARVLDGGATDSGRPYFVMELVRGEPITRYCDRERLSVPERLELFGDVCQAVQHAHQKGVIHRDLKPNNVLITVLDGHPVPKVIDFGIAKATASRLTDKTLFTEIHQLIGTPEYMSPEQADTSSADIDTRSDIYSLGVLLYELLTGTTPFDPQTLLASGLDELIRTIREQEPPRPSLRLATLASSSMHVRPDTPPRAGRTSADSSAIEVARHRRCEPPALTRALRGDLDWIVMKCLEKDRRRRYETASALAADVHRHMVGEAVLAAPPDRLYRVSKVLRRHRRAVMVAAGFVLLIAAGLVTTIALWQQAVHARDAESDQRARASAINAFLKDMLTAADPAKTRGEKLTVREALDAAAKRIDEGAFVDQPAVAAELRATIGKTYFALGLFSQAKLHLQAAEAIQTRLRGDDHPEVLHTRSQLARCYAWEGESALAVALARPTYERQRRVLGEDHPETLRTLSFLGNGLHLCDELEESQKCLRQALADQQRTLGREHADSIETMFYLSWSLNGVSDESVSLAREAREIATRMLGTDHPHTSYAALFLGMAYRSDRNYAESEIVLRHALEETRRVFGDEHVRTADCMAELGATLGFLGQFDEGIELDRQAVEIARRTYGPGKKWTLRYQQTLSYNLSKVARLAESEQVLADALAQARRSRGNEDIETLIILNSYANTLTKLGRVDEAVACAAEAYETACRTSGLQVELTRDFGRRYAQLIWKLGRRAESDSIIQSNLDACRAAYGPHAPQTVEEFYRCAWNYYDDGRYAEAEHLARESVDGYRRMESKFKSRMGSPQDILARIVAKLGRPQEALELALEAARAPEASAQHLNLAATYLLSTSIEELRDPVGALELALKANDLGRYENPNHLETLSRAYHQTGETEKAVELLRKAAALNVSKPDAIPSDLSRVASKLLTTPTEILYDPALGLELAVKAARHPDASADHLNFAAWHLLTTPVEAHRQPALALEFALKASGLSGYKIPAQLDTLALAYHRTGDTAQAIELQKKALSLLATDAPDRAEYEKKLMEYERGVVP